MMKLIDTHFHLDYYRNHEYWYNYFNRRQQYTLCVTNSPGVFYSCRNLYVDTRYTKFALGYHPQNVLYEKLDKQLFSRLAYSTRYIGEVGLDFTGTLKMYKSEQLENFEYICKLVTNNHILSVHSKNAERAVLDILKKYKIKKAILHWYTGDLETLSELINCGYYFSINNNMINSAVGRRIIKNIPYERILIESDGPFTKVNSKKYNPTYLQDSYNYIGRYLGNNRFEKLVWDNFNNILSL